VVMDLGWDS